LRQRIVNTDDLAGFYQVNRATIRAWARSKRLPPPLPCSGRRFRWDMRQVCAWTDSEEGPPVPRKDTTPPPARTPPTIDPHGVYDLITARATLQLAKGCLPREIRLGRLRASKRAGKVFILGAWLLGWIEGGEVRRGQRSPLNGHHVND
jgi:predicted DNA-binding transcriptional regulator AlpA